MRSCGGMGLLNKRGATQMYEVRVTGLGPFPRTNGMWHGLRRKRNGAWQVS